MILSCRTAGGGFLIFVKMRTPTGEKTNCKEKTWLLKVFPLQHGLLKNATAVVHLEIWRIMGADVCSVTCGGKSDCVSLLQEEETLEEK